jgi:Tfp pilus assembly protein PilO
MAQTAKAIREKLSNLLGQAAGISGSSFGVIFRRKSREWLPLIAWPGILAIGLLAVCVSVYFSTILPLQDRLEIATINTTATSELAKQAVRSERKTGVLPAEQLAEFYEFFPSDKDSPKWIGKIVEVAEKNGISLNHGDYSVARDKAGSLIRIKITLPIQGTYPQIRKYLSSLTAEVPVVSLEDVQFERKDIQDNLLQAKLRLVLYLVRAS